jgi:hypothetical protein
MFEQESIASSLKADAEKNAKQFLEKIKQMEQ